MKRMLMLVIGLVALLGCTAAQQETQVPGPPPGQSILSAGEVPPEFRIERVGVYPGAGDPSGLAVAPFMIEVEVGFPSVWGENGSFALTVDGRPVTATDVGGGVAGGRNTHRFRLFPGAPGTRAIAVAYDNNGTVHRAAKEYAFASTGDVLLTGHYDRELLLAPVPLRFLAYFVTDVRLALNGQPLATAAEKLPVAGEEFVLAAQPAWQPGLNTLTLDWKDSAGAAQHREYALRYAPDGKIPVGEPIAFGFGEVGGRTGPFYAISAGETGVDTTANPVPTWFPSIDDGTLAFRSALVETLTVHRPGPVQVDILRRSRIWMPNEVQRTVTLTAEPR